MFRASCALNHQRFGSNWPEVRTHPVSAGARCLSEGRGLRVSPAAPMREHQQSIRRTSEIPPTILQDYDIVGSAAWLPEDRTACGEPDIAPARRGGRNLRDRHHHRDFTSFQRRGSECTERAPERWPCGTEARAAAGACLPAGNHRQLTDAQVCACRGHFKSPARWGSGQPQRAARIANGAVRR